MHRIAFAFTSILGVFIASSASAQVVITQAKALAGNVTPGDTAGYPITLSQPGAYVLGSNLAVPNGIYGIYAAVDNIDIDLNGFTISGGGVGTYAVITYKQQGRIHGGIIKSFKSSGIFVRGDAWTIEGMTIVQNGGLGVDALNSNLISIQNSLVAVNGKSGILTGPIGYFFKNRIVNNNGDGIVCKDSCHVEANLIDLNKKSGIDLSLGVGLVIGNTITRNSSYAVVSFAGGASLSNNMIALNNPLATKQVSGVSEVHPNTCLGSASCISP